MRQNIAQAFPYDPAHPTVAERKPYPNFATYIDSNWGGRSNFNAFNTKLEHRGRSALLTFAYTWAKSTDTKSAAAGIGATAFNGWQGFLNNHDPERDHGLSDFDVDHRLVGSFVYNLPFGSGEKIASDASGVKEALVGGWQMNGIYTWQHGFPITVTAADLGGLNDSVRCEPSRPRRRSEHRRAHRHQVVQHRRLRATGGRIVRHGGTQHAARTRREQSRSRAVQELWTWISDRRSCSSGSSRSTC